MPALACYTQRVVQIAHHDEHNLIALYADSVLLHSIGVCLNQPPLPRNDTRLRFHGK